MPGKTITVSQLTLVSNPDSSTEGRKLIQYAAALSATIGALAFGGILGWSTSGGDNGEVLAAQYNMTISTGEFSWISSITNLGSAAICIPIGVLLDIVGRKRSMLLLVIPYTIGWALVIWANSVVMFCVGRFLLGFSGGAFCVAVPVYTAEIGEINIRGRLGAFNELMLTSGILISYVLGTFMKIQHLSMVFAIVPLIFFVVFSFMPESPVYYLMKNKEDLARESLLRLRGPKYDVENELRYKKEALAEELRNRGTFLEAIKSKMARNALIIAYGLMFFQQMSGVNAIVFYTGSIFDAGSSISPAISTIIVGGLQVFATGISSLVVDKLGRKILLLASITSMAVGTFALGIYYYLAHIKVDVSGIGWLPLASVCLFILMSALGFGPIPFMMVGELFSPQVKGIAGSSACCFCWLMAFVVTKCYPDFSVMFGTYTTIWIFSAVAALGSVFVVFIVPETKGKSLEQIQVELGGEPVLVPDPIKA